MTTGALEVTTLQLRFYGGGGGGGGGEGGARVCALLVCLHSLVCSIENRGYIIIGERAKRARHSQVCSIENRIYIIYYYILWYVQILFL